MHAAADRPEFAPPPPPGFGRAVALALAAHALLLFALTWGVSWKHEAQTIAVEAELWSATPQQIAPQAQEPTPAAPKVAPPTPALPAPPAPPQPREADIAVERDKKQKLQAKIQQEELERQKKQAQAQKVEDEKKKLAEAARAKLAAEQADAKRREALRQEQLDRINRMAGGPPSSQGKDAQTAGPSGPSGTYASRIATLFRRNVTFPNADTVAGNPRTEVEIRVSPSGLIMSSRITKPSGLPGWDDAVLRAIEKTERIPPDENGKIFSTLLLGFGPKDR